MKDDKYIQEDDESGNHTSRSGVLSSEMALSRLRHPSYREKLKLSNAEFNNELLEALNNFKQGE